MPDPLSGAEVRERLLEHDRAARVVLERAAHAGGSGQHRLVADHEDVAARVDDVVLASGDGDFDLLLERVRAGGAEATAYGVPGLTAQSLIRAATRYVPIEGRLLLR